MVTQRFLKGRIVLALSVSLFVSGCATVNVANIGELGYTKEDDEERIKKRCDEACELFNESDFIYQDEELTLYLNTIADKLVPENIRQEGLDITVKAVNHPSLNAFALPNGHIYLSLGMLVSMDNEAQLATVLGHELTHIINRHVLKSYRSIINKTAFLSTTRPVVGELGWYLGMFAVISSMYGFSRELENEADEGAFRMVIADDYDYRETPKIFEHLEQYIKDEDIKEPFFFSTHPRMKARIKNFKRLIDEYQAESTPAMRITNQKRFYQFTEELILKNASLNIQRGCFKSAQRNIDKYLSRSPDIPQGHFLLAELYRQRQDEIEKGEERDKEADFTQALEEYERALSIDNRFADAYKGKGRVYERLGQAEKAKESYQRYLELNPDAEDKEYIERFLTKD